METKRLSSEFFALPAPELAPALLGKLLCRRVGGGVLRLAVTETECYYGEADTACHAHKGRTNRTEILYGRGGFAYVYLCYGLHHLLNVVAGEEGFPQAVLIRGAGPHSGPGRVTRALSIDRSLNGGDLAASNELWLEEGGAGIVEYTTAPRVGIDYATPEYRDMHWRFILKPGGNSQPDGQGRLSLHTKYGAEPK